jgi:hypothetical protein
MAGFRSIAIFVILGLLVLAPMLGTATAQTGSGPLVKELVNVMGEAGTDTAAARHPSVDDQFVAVLLFPGRQLLVVTARYESPSLLYQQLVGKNYRNIYMDLQSASIPESKVFIDDLGANGLTFIPGEGEPYDTFSDASGATPFDGDWKSRDVSESDYTESFQEAEAIYVALLRALIAEIQGSV